MESPDGDVSKTMQEHRGRASKSDCRQGRRPEETPLEQSFPGEVRVIQKKEGIERGRL